MALPAHQNCFVLCEQHILMTHQIDLEVVQEHSDILYLTNQITQSCIPSYHYYTITGTIILTHKTHFVLCVQVSTMLVQCFKDVHMAMICCNMSRCILIL